MELPVKHLLDDIAELHKAFDHPCNSSIIEPKDERAALRLNLVVEEFGELISAHGLMTEPEVYMPLQSFVKGLQEYRINVEDMEETADAIGDLIVVLVGMALEYGIPLDRVWEDIHKSNMAKVGPNGKVRRRGDGKVLKPDGWTPPNMEESIRKPTRASWANPCGCVGECQGHQPDGPNRVYENGVEVPVSPQKPEHKLIQKSLNVSKVLDELGSVLAAEGYKRFRNALKEMWKAAREYEAERKRGETEPLLQKVESDEVPFDEEDAVLSGHRLKQFNLVVDCSVLARTWSGAEELVRDSGLVISNINHSSSYGLPDRLPADSPFLTAKKPWWLDDLCKALGWQGGTIHDAIREVEKLSLERSRRIAEEHDVCVGVSDVVSCETCGKPKDKPDDELAPCGLPCTKFDLWEKMEDLWDKLDEARRDIALKCLQGKHEHDDSVSLRVPSSGGSVGDYVTAKRCKHCRCLYVEDE